MDLQESSNSKHSPLLFSISLAAFILLLSISHGRSENIVPWAINTNLENTGERQQTDQHFFFTPAAAQTPPVILTQPQSQSAACGSNVTLQVSASGGDLVYQWRLDTIPLAGKTNASLVLTNLSCETKGTYSVVVTNALGSTVSSNAVVSANPVGTPALICPADESWELASLPLAGFPLVASPAPNSLLVSNFCGRVSKFWIGDAYKTNRCQTSSPTNSIVLTRTYGASNDCGVVLTCNQKFTLAGVDGFAILSWTNWQVLDPTGVTVYYAVSTIGGTPPFNYHWLFDDYYFCNETTGSGCFSNIFGSFSTTSVVSRHYGPTNDYPRYYNVKIYDACGAYAGPGDTTLSSPCAICLSAGTPSTINGSVGGGAGPIISSACGPFGTNSRWFRIAASNNITGNAIISTEGSDYDTTIAVFTGSIFNPTPLVCNTDIIPSVKQSRVQFQPQPYADYWLVVNATNGKTLRLTSSYLEPGKGLAVWRFNNTNSPVANPPPSSGTGQSSLVAGTSSSFTTGTYSDFGASNSAWSITGYPAQGTGNKSRGIQFNVSTLGYQYIGLAWDQRVGVSASKYFRTQVSTNGTSFSEFGPPIIMQADSTFEAKYVDLSLHPGLNNNSNFAVRIVAEFESTAIGTANPNYVTPSGTGYNPVSPVAVDLFTVFGTPIPKLTNSSLKSNLFSFAVKGSTGQQFIVETSTNLIHWSAVATNVLPYTFSATNVQSSGGHIFRAVSRP